MHSVLTEEPQHEYRIWPNKHPGVYFLKRGLDPTNVKKRIKKSDVYWIQTRDLLASTSCFYHPQPLQDKSGFIKMGGPGFYLSPAFKRSNMVVQYGAINHVPSYYLSHGIILFFSHCTAHVVHPDCTHADCTTKSSNYQGLVWVHRPPLHCNQTRRH